MISIERATELVDAWSGLDKWPLRPKAQAFLASTLAKAAIDEDHAKAIVRAFPEICPRPKDIENAAYRLGPQPESVMDRIRREFTEEVERAFRDHDTEALDFYQNQQPAIVRAVRKRMGAA